MLELEETAQIGDYCKFGAKRLAYFPPGTIAWGNGAGWADVHPSSWKKSKGPPPQTHGWRLHGDGTPRAGLWSDASNLQRHTGLMNKRGVHLIAFGPSDTTWSVDGTALADLT